ncbi:ABC transporter ATP-binding protein [Isoptericola halotolerans]|uniref:ABC transporter ATP-binding protein n=1 Tax=Isoptericola halotolerans TaxID=300560 RepID=UPI00388FF8EE
MSTLEIRAVRHRYPAADDDSLRSVSVSVDDGAMVSVVGPSGSGKSTLLRVAAGLRRSTTGRVEINGQDVSERPTEHRDLTVMFQNPSLFDHLDVAGNVAFAPRLAGVRRREARRSAQRYLRLVHLEGFDRRGVGALSGGQQQRVALARALAAERGVLLLDEPFSSLDRELRTSMHDLLTEVRAAVSPTILMVTHDIDEAALADSTVVLIDGTVHQQAPTSELYSRPASLPTARLLGGFTEVPGDVHHGVHHSLWGRIPVAADCPTTGDAVLVLRREALRLQDPAPGAARGGEPHLPGLAAQVVRRRTAGARVVASLTGDDGTPVEVEMPFGADVPLGARTRVELTPGAPGQWALPTAHRSGTMACREPSRTGAR